MNEKEFYVRCQWGNHSLIPSSIIFMGNIGFCASVVSTRDVELNILDKNSCPWKLAWRDKQSTKYVSNTYVLEVVIAM